MRVFSGIFRFKSVRKGSVIESLVFGRVSVRSYSDAVDHDRSTISHINSLKLYKEKFPKDKHTSNRIDQFVDIYEHLQVNREESTIKIGILDSKNRTLIPSLLADPLAAGNRVWFDEIVARNSSINNTFVYGEKEQEKVDSPQVETSKSIFNIFSKDPQPVEDSPVAVSANEDQVTVEKQVFRVPAPILSPIYRPKYLEAVNGVAPEVSNYIEVTEINNLQLVDMDQFHFLVQIVADVNDITSSSELPTHIASKVLFTVIDNEEYSPPSTETTPITFVANESGPKHHIIKINSQLAFEGIMQFLTYDTKASSQYVDSIRNSNLFELLKAVAYYSRSDTLSNWIFEEIKKSMASNVTAASIEQVTSKFSKQDLVKFSNSIHEELQFEFIPNTTEFFRKKLPWWKLYFKNDNVEYDLKDFFNKNFMSKSIENYNYFRGYIVLDLQQIRFANYTDAPLENPLLNLKLDLINNRLSTEVQPKVNSILLQGLVYYQLPISVISLLSWQYFDFSANSAVALALLGWVVGFNHVSKLWSQYSAKWREQLYERVRVCLGKECIDNGLMKELNFRVDEETKITETKDRILEELNRD